jgi:hypothetical protein
MMRFCGAPFIFKEEKAIILEDNVQVSMWSLKGSVEFFEAKYTYEGINVDSLALTCLTQRRFFQTSSIRASSVSASKLPSLKTHGISAKNSTGWIPRLFDTSPYVNYDDPQNEQFSTFWTHLFDDRAAEYVVNRGINYNKDGTVGGLTLGA